MVAVLWAGYCLNFDFYDLCDFYDNPLSADTFLPAFFLFFLPAFSGYILGCFFSFFRVWLPNPSKIALFGG